SASSRGLLPHGGLACRAGKAPGSARHRFSLASATATSYLARHGRHALLAEHFQFLHIASARATGSVETAFEHTNLLACIAQLNLKRLKVGVSPYLTIVGTPHGGVASLQE